MYQNQPPPYSQQPYPQQPAQYPMQQAGYPQQAQWGAQPMGQPQKKRNVALIIVGILMIVIALLPSAIFFYNLWQYATVEDRWASDPDLTPEARQFGVEIIQDAAMGRLMIFGPVSALFWLVGLVLGGLGLRKK